MTLDPARTWAVVVGVEEYAGLQPDWHLPGPADDAIQFVNWLLARDVPSDHIRLCLSVKTDERAAKLAKLSAPKAGQPAIVAGDATRGAIETLFNDEVAAWDGDLLFVFWGGHGSVFARERQEQRLLYCADAKPTVPSVVSLTDIFDQLSYQRNGVLTHQVFFVDTCATFYLNANFKQAPVVAGLAIGLQPEDVKQFKFFASRRGEAAGNLTAAQTGAFSRELLKELAAADKAVWPPDLLTLAKKVQAAFPEEQGFDSSSQTPIVDVSDWDGNSLFSKKSPQSQRRRRLVDLDSMLHGLLTKSFTTDRILSLYRATRPLAKADIATVGGMFADLDGIAVSPGKDRWPAELELAERVRRDVPAEEASRVGLTAWIGEYTALEQKDLRTALDAEDRATIRHLVIELANTASFEIVRAWLYADGESEFERSWPDHELAGIPTTSGRFQRILNDARAVGGKNLAVELVTPWDQLARSPYGWIVDEMFQAELGTLYPVSVRWRDRLGPTSSPVLGQAQDVAGKRFQLLKNRQTTRLEWLAEAIADRDAFWKSLDEEERADLFIGGHVAQKFSFDHPVAVALTGGAVAVCWFTDAACSPAQIKTELDRLLPNATPLKIAEALFSERRSQNPQVKQIFKAMVLLLDNYDRNPYSQLESPTHG